MSSEADLTMKVDEGPATPPAQPEETDSLPETMSSEADLTMKVDAAPAEAEPAVPCECLWYNRHRGFGFLQLVHTAGEVSDTTPPTNIFAHQSDIEMDGFRHLRVHQQVVCDIVRLPDGRCRALRIKP